MRANIPDLSHWTGKTNFSIMKSKGVTAVIAKASQIIEDDMFSTYWADAKAAGLIRGAYHYLDWRTSEVDQANLFCSLLKNDPGELPPILDLEMNPSVTATSSPILALETDPHPYSLIRPYGGGPITIKPKDQDKFGIGTDTLRARVTNFLNIVESKIGKIPMIYSGYYYWNSYMTLDAKWGRYPFWLAWYASESIIKVPTPWTKWTLWQYTDTEVGPAYGINALNLDMSYFNGTTEDLASFAKPVVVVPPVVTPPTHPDICPTCGQKWPQTATNKYIIVSGSPNVHSPDVTSPANGYLPIGTEVLVDDYTSNQWYCHITSPKMGWIYKPYTQKV